MCELGQKQRAYNGCDISSPENSNLYDGTRMKNWYALNKWLPAILFVAFSVSILIDGVIAIGVPSLILAIATFALTCMLYCKQITISAKSARIIETVCDITPLATYIIAIISQFVLELVSRFRYTSGAYSALCYGVVLHGCLTAIKYTVAAKINATSRRLNEHNKTGVTFHMLDSGYSVTLLIYACFTVLFLMLLRNAGGIYSIALLLNFGGIIALGTATILNAAKADKTVLRVLSEVYAGEGRTAEKQLIKTLKKHSKAKDEQAFLNAVNEAHARYVARENIILSYKDAKQVSHKTVVAATILDGKAQGKNIRSQCKAWYKERNFEQLHTTYTEYQARLEAYKNEIIARDAQHFEPENNGESTFDGTIWQRIGWTLLCNFVTMITLGLAYPATLCWKMRWQCKHTLYNGKRLSFDGTGLQLFGKWICWCLLTIITLGIYGFFLKKKLEQWKAKHTHIAGEFAALGGTFDGGAFVMWLRNCWFGFLQIITLGLAIPYAMCRKERWLCKHRVYDGKRLIFSGKAMGLFGKFIIWWLLSLVTLGIYAWVIPNRMLKWKAQHTTLSEEQEPVL